MSPHALTPIALVAWTILAAPPTSLDAAGKNDKNDKKKAATAEAPLVWPLPPDPARIRFVTAYRGVDDFKQKSGSRWKSMLLGPDTARNVTQLMKPYGVAVSRDGRVYVTDTVARRVFVFDPAAKLVRFVGENAPGKIVKPMGVAVDNAGRVFVADATLKRVFGYGADGRLAIAIGRDGELQNPSGLAIDRDRQVLYVADAKKHQVLCYSSADGSFLRAVGKRGVEQGEFNFPTNLAVDRGGRLYVADTLNFRVQVFDASGAVVRTIGSQGDGPGHLNRAKGVGVDSDGHIYIADTSFNNFQIFDADGSILLFVGTTGVGPGEFLLPAGLFVDDEDRIYVADQGNARVQVFQRVSSREPPKP
ncbi:MAG TPA: 6-bladed beta-propeller [Vicinamibacterales bacterium]|jgi:DNA-binding beta-propeller fold protein YncE|nr:6-bladed beta-propeller [Vicinamibacterales bacterium]